MQQNPKTEKFDLLPEAIREWFTSVEVSLHISKINEGYDLFAEKADVIPAAITRLVIGMVKPENFKSLLEKNLKRSPETISQITAQIAQKILAPVADALKTTQNIDLSPIMKLVPAPTQSQPAKKQGAPQSASSTPAGESTPLSKQRPASPPMEERRASLDSLAKQSQTVASTAQPEESNKPKKPMSAFASIRQGSLAQQAQKQKAQQPPPPSQTDTLQQTPDLEEPENFKAIDPDKDTNEPSLSKQQTQQAQRPFMLHEEAPKAPENKTSFTPDFSFELPGQAVQEKGDSQKTKAKVGFGNFFSRSAKEKSKQQLPKIESKKENPKVVHYSAFRTMLGNSDDKGNNN